MTGNVMAIEELAVSGSIANEPRIRPQNDIVKNTLESRKRSRISFLHVFHRLRLWSRTRVDLSHFRPACIPSISTFESHSGRSLALPTSVYSIDFDFRVALGSISRIYRQPVFPMHFKEVQRLNLAHLVKCGAERLVMKSCESTSTFGSHSVPTGYTRTLVPPLRMTSTVIIPFRHHL